MDSILNIAIATTTILLAITASLVLLARRLQKSLLSWLEVNLTTDIPEASPISNAPRSRLSKQRHLPPPIQPL